MLLCIKLLLGGIAMNKLLLYSFVFISIMPIRQPAYAQAPPPPRFDILQRNFRAENFAQQFSSQPDDENWDDRFGVAGVNYYVYAIATTGNQVYVGGEFSEAGGVSVSKIAMWDGSKWSALGDGIAGDVFPHVEAIAVNGEEIFVGGYFDRAGGLSTNNIAKWDGANWSTLGSGVNSAVAAIAVKGDEIYVGGGFSQAGEVAVNNIAKWDGATWSSLAGGVNGSTVYAVVVSGNDVYVGGDFTQAGGVNINHIAKWDGARWSSLGNGVTDIVTAITVNGQDVYTATYQGQSQNSSILKWNGSQWTYLLKDNPHGYLTGLTFKDGTLYVGGFFQAIAGKNIDYLARWNGTTWLPVGDGSIDGGVYELAFGENEVLIGGVFEYVDGVHVRHIARWNGDQWSTVGSGRGLNDAIHAMAVDGNNIYAGGLFTYTGQTHANYVAKWNGQDWENLGNGINSSISAMGIKDNELYVGGYFTRAGETEANNIARWDGAKWLPLGTGTNHTVYSIAADSSGIYAGGYFDKAGGWSARHIGKWDGNDWSVLGSGTNGLVNVIATHENEVIVSGTFTTAGGRDLVNVAKWDGNDWSSFGDGMLEGGYASSMEIHKGEIYFAGSFPRITHPETIQVVKWDGNRWSMLGDETGGFGGLIYDMVFVGDELYVAGSYMKNWEFATYGISRWDGETWWPLGSGLNGGANALCIIEDELYAGGFFNKAGNKQSMNFAHWGIPPSARNDAAVTDEELPVAIQVLSNDNATKRGINIGSLTIVQPPANGVVEILDGTINYAPQVNFFGTEIFKYQVEDNNGYISNAANVTITVQPINDPPGAFSRLQPQDSSVVQSNSVRFIWTLADNVDGDTISYILRLTAGAIDTNLVARDTTLAVDFRALGLKVDSSTVNWRVSATDGRLSTQPANGDGIFIFDIMTGIKNPEIANLPSTFALHESYPNPLHLSGFNSSMTLRYDLPQASRVSLEIYDLLGRRICVLLDKEQAAGSYEARWNGQSDRGMPVVSGIYFCRLQAVGSNSSKFSATKKMLLLK
jgi:hypothetical protein